MYFGRYIKNPYFETEAKANSQTAHMFPCRHHVISGNVDSSHVGTSNPGFHGSTTAVTTHVHTTIANHVRRADSNPALSHDETHSFEDEGMDSDVGDLSELGSGDDEDWDRPDDYGWDRRFIAISHH